ncbi:RES family NAD+ phosphorylase [Chitinimonas sp. BJB300]|uniref:RES family NAD+ phosphorylase n=1 Tax=Chitinimonas sp. BJB300 TaxID=1559339 RepID=UPI000C114AB6|nr:RES family NAD+ phosphorylase [Chitinimonas sp. BJB300]PHV10070.1 hypothetical protein CSQ89_18160 [Chitinimonas sp. BJB300]TSJ83275.1 RES domain-containing protein [Chitinimonas sp. BJB300]
MPIAVVANSAPTFTAWRSVESQTQGTTLRLVGNNLAKQDILEQLLESAKPPVPPGVESDHKLHYLLFTPFRYAACIRATRFGAVGTAGIFYAADQKITALAEIAYWKTQFTSVSEGLKRKNDGQQRTLFQVSLAGPAVDLRLPPFDATPEDWNHPSNYSQTWEIGRKVREANTIDMVRYASVRDPGHRGCVAVFHPRAFMCSSPLSQESWTLYTQENRAILQRLGEKPIEFVF